MGNAEHQVDQPGDGRIHLASAEGGRASQHKRDACARPGRQKADQHALREACDGAHQHIVAQSVGAEDMLRRRRKRAGVHVGLDGRVRKQHAGDHHARQNGKGNRRCNERLLARRHPATHGSVKRRGLSREGGRTGIRAHGRPPS